MKSKLLCLAMVLSASLSATTSEATQTILPDQQICVNATKSTPVNEVKSLSENESIESQNTVREKPNPEMKKRHIFAKTVLGLAGTFVAAVIIFIVATGGWEFKY